ncbi:dienelactone hydrolase family protein [Marinilactibacillus sp. Marseille-P9653]|uniref:dienelactone hydrolase family protein n=1 Tax=Marinilactibacillus sp. Marseille-P9653 TaxID=2866583 RepID=UPI001CE49595|nr:dienelactone hydrolase family protein [Marinilactibacillus sp. Marseille-P9653]
MFQIIQKTINEIPILEVVKEDLINEEIPTVIFYHGWTSHKESVLVQGYELAKRGIRAILPEAYMHGERVQATDNPQDHTVFWRVVSQNLKEVSDIRNDYLSKGLSDPEKFGISGLSMGGITTSAMLTQFDWIHSAAILMGNPSPIEFSKWLLTSKWYDGYESVDGLINDEMKRQLDTISLKEQPQKLAGKPVYFWHGTKDELVPFEQTEVFIEMIKDEPYAENISFSIGSGHGHKVPYEIAVEMAKFFAKSFGL